MKVVRSIRTAYEHQFDINTRVQSRSRKIIKPLLEARWHYEDRIKSEDSFALKIETGRFDPLAIEDFFACTIVVENVESIKRAVTLVSEKCVISERRPKSDSKTHKPPDQFPFDDLRLYVRFKADPSLPPKDIDDVTFEIQIKTYLQHAWSIATHDLIYKHDDINWAQQRIAYQTKALLESAETAISSSQTLAQDPTIAKEDWATEKERKAIAFIKRTWNPETLPSDTTRLAKTLISFRKATDLSIDEIERCLRSETATGRGVNMLNLPPYLIIIQSLISADNAKLKAFLTTEDADNKFKVLITSEMEIPANYPSIRPEKMLNC